MIFYNKLSQLLFYNQVLTLRNCLKAIAKMRPSLVCSVRRPETGAWRSTPPLPPQAPPPLTTSVPHTPRTSSVVSEIAVVMTPCSPPRKRSSHRRRPRNRGNLSVDPLLHARHPLLHRTPHITHRLPLHLCPQRQRETATSNR